MNSTDIDTNGVDAPPAYALGNGPLSVDFNHRVHTTSIYAQRNTDAGELLTNNGGGYQYWTVTWNGPYQGQMSDTARFPTNTWGGAGKTDVPPSQVNSRTRFFMRPHDDMRFLKMCNVAPQISDISYLLDIVQPRPQAGGNVNRAVFITYMSTAGFQRVARCTLIEAAGTTGINHDFRQSMPYSAVGTNNMDQTCFTNPCTLLTLDYTATVAGSLVPTQTFNQIVEGGIKIVPNNDETANHDHILMVDTNPPAAGTSHHTGNIIRCRIEFATGNIENNSCRTDPICPERNNRNAFGYFSDCRDTSSCGIYYMGTVPEFNTKNLMNRVYCVDMIHFNQNEDPLMYRRHFTAVHAFDVSGYVQSTIESESNSMSIRSYQEIMMYPDAMIGGSGGIDPTSATNWFVQWTNTNGANTARLWDRNPVGQDN